MALIRSIFIATSLVVSSMLIMGIPASYAQGANTVVYDQARVMRETTGGQDISQKVNAIGQSMQTELESEGSAIETEGKALQTRTANLTQEAAAADPNLRSQIESFARKRQTFGQKSQLRQAELQRTEQEAWAKFFQALQPVVQEVAVERGAQIVLERSTLAYSDPALDVTSLVISKMNERAASFDVTRVRAQVPPETIQQ